MKGTLRRFDPSLGFGFIYADDGREVFLHTSEIVDGTRPRPGLRLEFDVEPSPDGRGPVAVNAYSTARTAKRPAPVPADPPAADDPRRGVIRRFYPERGFGWVKPTVGAGIFFNASNLLDPAAVGDEVTFETSTDARKRLEAVRIRRAAPMHRGGA